MRLLANENIPSLAIAALRASGQDVAWIIEDSPGIGDRGVLERALRESRVLLTQDKDFGELAFRSDLPVECGVILVRLPTVPPADFAELLNTALLGRDDWTGHFSVIELGRVRVTPLPAGR